MAGPGTTVPGPDLVLAPGAAVRPAAVLPGAPSRWRSRLALVGFPIFAMVLFVSFWQVVHASLPDRRKFLVPAPWAVWRDGFADAKVRSQLLHATYFTAKESMTGLLIATILGVGLAIVMSQARWMERAVFPWAVALQTIPILALVPFISIRYGYEFKSRVIVCVLIAVFPIITNTLFGLQSADEGHHDLFTLHRAGRPRRLWKLQLPGALPAIFTGLRISAGLSVVGAIVGEYFFRRGSTGLGQMVEQKKALRNFDTDPQALFATVITICVLGILVFAAISVVSSLVTRSWYEPAGSSRD